MAIALGLGARWTAVRRSELTYVWQAVGSRTSMAMKALGVAGFEVVTDDLRTAGEDTPKA